MPELIWAKSPNGNKAIIGRVDYINRIAIFDITPARFFQEANAIGIDETVFGRKAVQWCKRIMFKMWSGEIYEILIEDFRDNAWLYPPRNDPEYKAHRGVFKPKLVLTMPKIEEFAEKARKVKDEEILKAALM